MFTCKHVEDSQKTAFAELKKCKIMLLVTKSPLMDIYKHQKPQHAALQHSIIY